MTIYIILSAIIVLFIFLYKKTAYYVPILMYHRIANVEKDRNSLPPDKFAWQMQFLHENGFHTITPEMLYNFYTNGDALPAKPILLTFDDGYEDNYTIALPLLKQYGMTAVVFPIAGWIGRKNHWENFGKQETTTMTWEQLKVWQSSGQAIASHTMEHPFLGSCSDTVMAAELHDSREKLNEKLGIRTDFLCYPYGDFNEKVVSAAKHAGYKAAFAIFEGISLSHVDLYALPRIPIPAHQSQWEFRLKISRLFIIFIAMRKLERDFKRWCKLN